MTSRGTTLPVDPRRLAAPALSLVGLVVVALASIGLLTGDLPFGGPGGPDGGPIRTPTPSDVVVVDPRTKVPGSIVYVKAGNVWIQSGERAYQVTSGGRDSMPSWSPDGAWIFFVRTVEQNGSARVDGVQRRYRLHIETIMRVTPDGEGTPEPILSGDYRRGASHWTFFLHQPVMAPDGSRLAVISDGPVPSESDVVLKFLDPGTGQLTSAGAAKDFLLGHQDPAWAPDGSALLVVRNGRDGNRGAPRLLRYDVASGRSTTITGPGYIQPAWSPDGEFIAATRTDAIGTDVVLLDGRGIEVLRVTADEHSFAPSFSPAGDALVFLRESYGVVDAWLVRVTRSDGAWTVGEPLQLTFSAGLDAASRPGWFISPELLPTPSPTLAPTPPPSLEPAASASSAAASSAP
jgi:dipeptidyl aminopeptidase/acylaminoacyl peptidase